MVRVGDGGLAVGRHLPGRGAWLCAEQAAQCVRLAARRRAFERALRASLAEGAVAALVAQLEQA